MYGSEFCVSSFWWIVPVVMIAERGFRERSGWQIGAVLFVVCAHYVHYAYKWLELHRVVANPWMKIAVTSLPLYGAIALAIVLSLNLRSPTFAGRLVGPRSRRTGELAIGTCR